MTATTTTDPIAELEALGELPHLHKRMQDGIVWLRAHNHDAAMFASGVARLNDIADAYLSGLERLREAVSDDELQERVSVIEQRLNVGWDRTGPAAEDRWVQLLTVHQILVDALLSRTYLERLRERIELSRMREVVA